MEERLTKKERIAQRKLEELSKMEETKSASNMKWIVIAAASFLFLAFFVFAIVASKEKTVAPVTLSSTSGWSTGNLSSNVTLTEFGDFQCPACGVFEPTFEQIVSNYSKKIKVVFKEFPLKAAHPNGMAAAVAAEAAGKQGKFWEYHNLLYSKQDEWSPIPDPTDQFIKYAISLKLDSGKFKTDLTNKDISAKVDAQENEGISVGVNSTPSIFINGVLQQNKDYDSLKKEIDKLLSPK